MLTLESSWQEDCDCGGQVRHNNGGNYHRWTETWSDGYDRFIVTGSTRDSFPGDTWVSLWEGPWNVVRVTEGSHHMEVEILRPDGWQEASYSELAELLLSGLRKVAWTNDGEVDVLPREEG